MIPYEVSYWFQYSSQNSSSKMGQIGNFIDLFVKFYFEFFSFASESGLSAYEGDT